MQINKTKDQKTAQSLLKKISALQKQMMTDPAYARTISALEKIYVRKGYMPAAFSGGSSDSKKFVSFNEMPNDAISKSRNTESTNGPTNNITVNIYPGDIMLIRPARPNWTAYYYAMWYSHAGTYHGSNFVYDSNQDGVKLNNIQGWKQSGNYLAFAYNRSKWPQAANALNWAENKYGTNGRTGYNYWFTNKWTDWQLYCSQLVWKINGAMGTDVDSNAWQYYSWLAAKYGNWAINSIAVPAVSPDELYYSGNLYFYAQGWVQ